MRQAEALCEAVMEVNPAVLVQCSMLTDIKVIPNNANYMEYIFKSAGDLYKCLVNHGTEIDYEAEYLCYDGEEITFISDARSVPDEIDSLAIFNILKANKFGLDNSTIYTKCYEDFCFVLFDKLGRNTDDDTDTLWEDYCESLDEESIIYGNWEELWHTFETQYLPDEQ